MSFKDSYLGKLREKIGHAPVLIPGARVIILNDKDEVLMIKRTDFNTWGFIGGSAEYGESIIETAKREAFEEAGVEVNSLELWGISTKLEDEQVKYPNGDIIHAYSTMFYTRDWSGEIKADLIESSAVEFFALDDLPRNVHPNTQKAIDKFREFLDTKKIIIT